MGLRDVFEFATAGRIVFGEGAVREVAPAAKTLGSKALVVAGGNVDRAQALLDSLEGAGVDVRVYSVTGEPTVDTAREGADRSRAMGAELVVGFGGGSVLDAAKAIAALATNAGDVFEYLEVIGKGHPLSTDPLPCIAVPTTAGTGSEVTRNAVLASPEHRVKVSLRHPLMLPRLAVIDPELTYSMPRSITAATGLDALTQVIEPYVTPRGNPVVAGFCREGILRASRSLEAVAGVADPRSRKDMALVSLFGGLALANAKLGAVHGIAGPLGGMFPGAPHGAICGRLLPPVMRANVANLRRHDPDHPALIRYREIARWLTGHEGAEPEDGIAWVDRLVEKFGLPRLAAYGLTETAFPELIESARRASSMKGNPAPLSPEELESVCREAL